MTDKEFVLAARPRARATYSEATKTWRIRIFHGRLMGMTTISDPTATLELAWRAAAERLRARARAA